MPLSHVPTRPLGRAVGQVCVVLVVIGLSAAVAAFFRTSTTVDMPSGHYSQSPSTAARDALPGGAVPKGSPAGPRLSGDGLARAWLTAFCTRTDRTDTRWLAEVSSLSSPDLVRELSADGPDAVGLTRLSSWRVERLDPVALDDRPLDTSTRQVLAYAVTVTDGTRTVQKPFVLYAYLDPSGRWRVEQVEQPYFSEG